MQSRWKIVVTAKPRRRYGCSSPSHLDQSRWHICHSLRSQCYANYHSSWYFIFFKKMSLKQQSRLTFNTDFIEHPSSSSMMELIVQDPADTRQQLHRVTLPLSGCHTHILLSAIFSVSGSFFTLELVQCDPKAISKLTKKQFFMTAHCSGERSVSPRFLESCRSRPVRRMGVSGSHLNSKKSCFISSDNTYPQFLQLKVQDAWPFFGFEMQSQQLALAHGAHTVYLKFRQLPPGDRVVWTRTKWAR